MSNHVGRVVMVAVLVVAPSPDGATLGASNVGTKFILKHYLLIQTRPSKSVESCASVRPVSEPLYPLSISISISISIR